MVENHNRTEKTHYFLEIVQRLLGIQKVLYCTHILHLYGISQTFNITTSVMRLLGAFEKKQECNTQISGLKLKYE